MAEYIKREDVLEEFEKWVESTGYLPKGTSYYYECKGCIEEVPAADVVEVVRCMNCNRSEKRNGNRYCTYWHDTVDPVHYCSKGERKAE